MQRHAMRIVYNCTSVIAMNYTEKFMHRETLGSFHAGFNIPSNQVMQVCQYFK